MKKLFLGIALSLISCFALASIDDGGSAATTNGQYPQYGWGCNSNSYSVEINNLTWDTASVKIVYLEPGTTSTFIDVPDTPTWTSGTSQGTIVNWAHKIALDVSSVGASTSIGWSIYCN